MEPKHLDQTGAAAVRNSEPDSTLERVLTVRNTSVNIWESLGARTGKVLKVAPAAVTSDPSPKSP